MDARDAGESSGKGSTPTGRGRGRSPIGRKGGRKLLRLDNARWFAPGLNESRCLARLASSLASPVPANDDCKPRVHRAKTLFVSQGGAPESGNRDDPGQDRDARGRNGNSFETTSFSGMKATPACTRGSIPPEKKRPRAGVRGSLQQLEGREEVVA